MSCDSYNSGDVAHIIYVHIRVLWACSFRCLEILTSRPLNLRTCFSNTYPVLYPRISSVLRTPWSRLCVLSCYFVHTQDDGRDADWLISTPSVITVARAWDVTTCPSTCQCSRQSSSPDSQGLKRSTCLVLEPWIRVSFPRTRGKNRVSAQEENRTSAGCDLNSGVFSV